MKEDFSSIGFVRAMLLPAVMLFVLPAFGVWFAGHAERTYDERFQAGVFAQIDADGSLSEAERGQAKQFYASMPPSVACFDTHQELAGYRESLGELCSDAAQFAYSRWAALAALLLGGFGVLVALVSALASFLSRPAQYLSFAVGWNVLKVVGALETVLQGGLALWLSFWMTAIWTERYYVKLILVVGALVGMAVFGVLRAIFRKPDGGLDVEGEVLDEAAAPALWARLRALCAELQTAPPTHIVAGIDDNFFVTEDEVRVAGQSLRGRTLYVSLSLLRLMQRSEAEAILAHEMAHFSGGDTRHANRLAPLVTRFIHYLESLHAGVITRPIFYFMRAYFAVFQLAVSRSSREREHEADRVAARVISAMDVARSLVKVGAYASFRGRVEEGLFEKDEAQNDLGIAQRVAVGFAGYVQTEALHFDLHGVVTPHPFDSHPPLSERIAHVGAQLDKSAYEAVLSTPVQGSWFDAIVSGGEIEARLWKAYEARFSAAHDLDLAYRYLPENDAERAHVEKYFPAISLSDKEGQPALHVNYETMHSTEWDAPLPFAEVVSASIEERMFRKFLDLKLKKGGLFKGKLSVPLSKLQDADGAVEVFNRYYGRHQIMTTRRAQRSS